MITAEQQAALARLAQYNTGEYSPTGNPYGLTGEGGTDANFDLLWRDVVTVAGYLASIGNDINFVTERAAVATILQRCQELVDQITPGSTSALAFPAVDKLLLSTPNVARVFVYDTRLDDLATDGRRWNEPGRCSHLSYWHEAQGVYRGVKRDFPAVALIVALKEQWWIYDALDLDPVTGMPRLWAASNPTGNGLVLCGSSAPITSVFARNGYLFFGTGMGLHVVSLSGDWCDRLDNIGRRRRLGNFAQRNTVLAEGGVTASGAIAATQVNGVHARVLPGAPLDAAGMPIPTVLVMTSAGAAVIHPTGQLVHITLAAPGYHQGRLLPDGRVWLGLAGGARVDVGPLPYATATHSAWRTTYFDTAATAVPSLLAGSQRALAAGACGGTDGLTLVAEDAANPAAGMVAYVTPTFATGWQPGEARLATLCDATTGSITGSGELVSNPGGPFTTAAGYGTNGAAFSVSAGELVVAAATSGGYGTISIATVPGSTYMVAVPAKIGTTTAARVRAVGLTVLNEGYTTAPTIAPIVFQFTADSATTEIRLACDTVGTAAFDGVSCKLACADRSYKGRGLIPNGTLQRNPVAVGSDVVAWSGFSAGDYLWQPPNPDLDFGTGDFCFALWAAGNAFVVRRAYFTAGAFSGADIRFISTGNLLRFGVSDGATLNNCDHAIALSGVAMVLGVKRGATLELWLNGVRVATAPVTVGSLSNGGATLRIGTEHDGAVWGTPLSMLRIAAYAPTPAQIRRMYEDERPLFADGAKCLLGGNSPAVSSLYSDPLTGRLVVGTGDGVSVFSRLRRVSYLDEAVLAATTSDTIRSVALHGGHMLIGTAAEVGFVGDAIGGKEAIAVGGPRPIGAGFVARGMTTDGAALDLAPRVPVGERETVLVEVRIVGRVVGAADTERLTYVRRATYFHDAGGAITLQGSVQTGGTDTEVTGTADATLAITGDWVAVRVTGVSGKRIRWEATFIITRLSEETSYAA